MSTMAQFTCLSTTTVALPAGQQDDVDTDQIIPARFLKGVSKTGLGQQLFYDWRYLPDGTPNPAFVLNQPSAKQAQVLVARHNFGCGSSREHAPWALVDYGFRAIFAVSFADIFKNNAVKNGLLPLVLPEPVIDALLQNSPVSIDIHLERQQIQVLGQTYAFEIDPFRKTCLLQGVDDIGFSCQHLEAISQFEQTQSVYG